MRRLTIINTGEPSYWPHGKMGQHGSDGGGPVHMIATLNTFRGTLKTSAAGLAFIDFAPRGGNDALRTVG